MRQWLTGSTLARISCAGGLGHAGVDRRMHGDAAAEDLGLPLVDGLAERGVEGGVEFEPLQDVVTEIGVVGAGDIACSRARAGLGGDVQHVSELDGLGVDQLLVGDQAQLEHPVEDDVASGQRPVGVVRRVRCAGALRQTRDHRRLGQAEVFGVLGEVMLRRCLHPIGLVAVVDDVEVALQDLVLALGLLQLDRVLQLPQLAGQARQATPRGRGLRRLGVTRLQRGVLEDELDVLLGQSRATLNAGPGRVGDQGAHQTMHVDPAVLVEPAVLDGQLRPLHHRRDRAQRDDDAVLDGGCRDDVAPGVEDPALLRQRRGG